MCNIFYSVNYTNLQPVSLNLSDTTTSDDYNTVLMEDKCFSLTAITRLHNLIGHTVVNCLNSLMVC